MKICEYCGGPSNDRAKACEYCGMSFPEDTIPEMTESEKAEEAAKVAEIEYKNKPLVEFESADGTPTLIINPENGKQISIDDPIGKAASLAGLASVVLSSVQRSGSNGHQPPMPGHQPSSFHRPGRQRSSSGCANVGCLLPILFGMLITLCVL